MIVIGEWTARRACLLQAAMRLTNETFAQKAGFNVRTVSTWHDKPKLVPRMETQRDLDTMVERATPLEQERFAKLLAADAGPGRPDGAQALKIAVAIVLRADSILLVCRRNDSGASQLFWQFPSGVIKPGNSPERVAASETLAETGVHCAPRSSLGGRVHPVTGALCEYVLCDYLTGEAHNGDVIENMDVAWVPLDSVEKFIPVDRIFRPVLDILEAA